MIIQLPGEKNIQPNISFICSRLSDGKKEFRFILAIYHLKIETKYDKWDEDSNTKDKEWDEDKFQTYRVEVEEWQVTVQKLPNQLLTS